MVLVVSTIVSESLGVLVWFKTLITPETVTQVYLRDYALSPRERPVWSSQHKQQSMRLSLATPPPPVDRCNQKRVGRKELIESVSAF